MEKMSLVSKNEDYTELKVISKIKKNNLLLNISSHYNLKQVFSYLKYSLILKLIKYNKIIQNKIGFDKQNYINYTNTKYIIMEYRVSNRTENFEKLVIFCHLFEFIDLIWIICYKVYKKLFQTNKNYIFLEFIDEILYYKIYKLIFYAKDLIIIYLSLFVIFSAIFGKSIFLYGLLFHDFILSLFLIIFDIFYNFLIIFILISRLILIISCSIDFLFLLINSMFISSFFYIFKIDITTENDFYLIKYKYIPVKNYILKDFDKKEIIKYISKIEKELKYYYSYKDLNILKEISYLRKKNNLGELKFECNIPDFILEEISEIFLNNSQNLFKLKDKYLLKYKIGEFQNYYKCNGNELNDILLKNDLKKINFIVEGNMRYISFY